MVKNARRTLVESGVLAPDVAPSYFVECLVYNLPDQNFGQSWQQALLAFLKWSSSSSDAALYMLECQDGRQRLFGSAAGQWDIAVELIDIGHSGAKASRPALDALKQAARRSEVRQVKAFALDRLGRSLRDLLLLLDELTAAGCAVISLRESLDLTTPTGRLLVHLVAALADFEREIIRERVRAGLARVKATGRTRSGKAVGRPKRDVDDHIGIMVPVERSINPVTQTDWEGTGVEPDVKVPGDKALERALELARAQVEAAKPGPAP